MTYILVGVVHVWLYDCDLLTLAASPLARSTSVQCSAVVYYVAAICCCCKANTRRLIPVSATPCRWLILARGVGSCSRTQPQQRDSWHRRRHRQIPERSPDRNNSTTYMTTHALSVTYQSLSTRYRPPTATSTHRRLRTVIHAPLPMCHHPHRHPYRTASLAHHHHVSSPTRKNIYYSQTGNGSQQKISKTRNVGQCPM